MVRLPTCLKFQILTMAQLAKFFRNIFWTDQIELLHVQLHVLIFLVFLLYYCTCSFEITFDMQNNIYLDHYVGYRLFNIRGWGGMFLQSFFSHDTRYFFSEYSVAIKVTPPSGEFSSQIQISILIFVKSCLVDFTLLFTLAFSAKQ